MFIDELQRHGRTFSAFGTSKRVGTRVLRKLLSMSYLGNCLYSFRTVKGDRTRKESRDYLDPCEEVPPMSTFTGRTWTQGPPRHERSTRDRERQESFSDRDRGQTSKNPSYAPPALLSPTTSPVFDPVPP